MENLVIGLWPGRALFSCTYVNELSWPPRPPTPKPALPPRMRRARWRWRRRRSRGWRGTTRRRAGGRNNRLVRCWGRRRSCGGCCGRTGTRGGTLARDKPAHCSSGCNSPSGLLKSESSPCFFKKKMKKIKRKKWMTCLFLWGANKQIWAWRAAKHF